MKTEFFRTLSHSCWWLVNMIMIVLNAHFVVLILKWLFPFMTHLVFSSLVTLLIFTGIFLNYFAYRNTRDNELLSDIEKNP